MATRIRAVRRTRGRKSAKPAAPRVKKDSAAASARRAPSRARRPAQAKASPSKKDRAPRPASRARRPTIFISYRHARPYTKIARKLYEALRPAAEFWGAEVFMDQHALEPADLFDQKLIQALDRTTHFIALLSNDYWSSTYCRKEIAHIIDRFEKGHGVRPLFVKAEEFNLRYFTFDSDRRAGHVSSPDPLIAGVGDLHFLGPFDKAQQLQRLEVEDPPRLSDQIAQLVEALHKVIDR